MLKELLKQVAVALDNAALPYMVFGGQAELIYGEPRLTQDIDITLGIEPWQAQPVLALVERLGFFQSCAANERLGGEKISKTRLE